MLNLILYTIIIAAGSGAGYLMARTYENRILHLQDLITALKVLEAEMKYRRDPLPVLFNRIGQFNSGLAGEFFLHVCNGLKGEFSYDFYGSWLSAVNEVYGDSSLTDGDREVLSEVGIELGKTDLSSQQSIFERVYSRLGQKVAEAERDKKTKGKMYQALGTAAGVLVVIVLL